MKVIDVRNVNEALPTGLAYLKSFGTLEDSRNGKVLRAPGPVMTVYRNPLERVLFDPLRDANPFFHFMEAMWMLAGRNDVETVARYVKRMAEYSDDGRTFWGAYGYRWRHWFGGDQIISAIHELKENQGTRRAVIAMWDGRKDQDRAFDSGRDVPCNLTVAFARRGDALDATVFCRSNDAVWGAHGANAVHFSYLLEYVALGAELKVGTLYQLSNDYHVYADREDVKRMMDAVTTDDVGRPTWRWTTDAYRHGGARPRVMGPRTAAVDRDLVLFFEGAPLDAFETTFFKTVAWPIKMAHEFHRAGLPLFAIKMAESIGAEDWRKACCEWLDRRNAK